MWIVNARAAASISPLTNSAKAANGQQSKEIPLIVSADPQITYS